MSKYEGRIISATKPSVSTNSASGVWTVEEAMRYKKEGVWPFFTSSDPYFDQTVLLLKGDGNQGATNFYNPGPPKYLAFSDNSDNNFPITVVGDAYGTTISPYQATFSNYFDGNGDYLEIPDSSVFDFSNQEFTVEAWIYGGTGGTRTGSVVLNQSIGGAASNSAFYFGAGTNGISLYLSTTGTSWTNFIETGVAVGNFWSHVVWQRRGNTLEIYLNGQLQSVVSGTASFSGTVFNSSRVVEVGRQSTSGSNFLGYISNLRAVKGTALYTSNFTPSTTPLTAVSGTSLLTCQSNRFIDNSNNNFAITRNGDTLISPFQPFTLAANDNGSGYFDGNGDYLNIPNNASLTPSGDFCIEFWAYPTSVAGTQEWYSKGYGIQIYIISNSWGVALSSSNTSSYYFSNNTKAAIPNVWQHLALTRNGNTYNWFVNGELIATTTSSSSPNTGSDVLRLGDWSGSAQYPVFGYISNVRYVNGSAIYTSAFTPPTVPLTAVTNTQLLALQYSGTVRNVGFIDSGQSYFPMTKSGNITQGSFSPFSISGWSAYFDGTGDVLTVPDSAFSQLGGSNFTVECWINTLKTSSQQILTKGVDENVTWGNFAFGVNSSGYVNFIIDPTPSTSADQFSLVDNVAINDGQWHHVAVTRSGNTWRLFRDGELAASGSSTANFSDDSYAWVIGGTRLSGSTVGTWLGYISNLRLIKGSAVYTSAFTPSTVSLVPTTDTAFLLCASNRFVDEGPYRFTVTKVADTKITNFSPFETHTSAPISHSVYCSDDGISTSDYAGLALGSNNFTIELWVYPVSLTAASCLFAKTTNPTKAAGYIWVQAEINTNGTIRGLASTSAGSWAVDVATTSTVSVGTWSHVAMVRNGTDLSIYVNGVKNTLSSSFSGSISVDAATFTIGRAGTTETKVALTGYVSNFRLVNGTAVYTANFTVPTAPLTAITNTQLLTCQTETSSDASPNNRSMSVNEFTFPSKFNPFGVTVTTEVVYSPAVHGGSAYLDGNGDWLDTPSSDSRLILGTTSNSFTIDYWIYPTGTLLNRVPITSSRTSTLTGALLMQFGTSNDLTLWINNTNLTASSTNNIVSINAWNHIRVMRIGLNYYYYINGNRVNNVASNTNSLTLGNWRIGSWFTTSTHDFSGYITDVRIINGTALNNSFGFALPSAPLTVVDQTQLLLNFANAGIYDQTGKNVLETVGNAQIDTNIKKYNIGSMKFDGTTDYVLQTTNENYGYGTGDFTIEFWVYLSDTTQRTIVSHLTSSSSTNPHLYFRSASNSIAYYTAGSDRIIGTSITTGVWYHIALSRASGSTRLFFNGSQVGSTYSDTNNYGASAPLGIGTYWEAGSPVTASTFNGYIDDLRITKGVARYTTTFTPPALTLPNR